MAAMHGRPVHKKILAIFGSKGGFLGHDIHLEIN